MSKSKAVPLLCCLLSVVGSHNTRAWEIDGLRSGMTVAEASAVVLAQGDSIVRRVPVRNGHKNTYFLQLMNGYLGFCSDVLYMYERTLPGGFEAFVAHTEREAERRGRPRLRSITVKLELIAMWELGTDQLSYAVSKEFGTNKFHFTRSHDDLSIEERCKTP